MMKLPETNSRGETILKAFLIRPAMTIYQGAEAHGEFPNAHQPRGVNHAKMVELYTSLVERDCLVKEGIVFRITEKARGAMVKKLSGPEEPRSIVPARIRNFFAQPLFVGFSPFSPHRVSL